VSHQLTKAGFSTLSVEGRSQAEIRNLIDNFGYTQAIHAGVSRVSQPALASTGVTMPGIDFRFIAGPGTPGFDIIPNLTNQQGLINSQFPPGGGIAAPGLAELTREAIDRLLTGFGLTGEEPIAGGVMVPIPGAPGGSSPVPLPGATVGGCRGRFSNRTPWILGPNGFPTCPRGYHPLKTGEPYCVRNRRMNPLNPRALSRAGRRVGGFARAVKRARTLKKVCRSL